jgi:DNA-binding transcriptional regulator YdaS (Cro superfamily)
MKQKVNPCKAFRSALSAFGTQAAMANALGVSQPTVSRWKRLPATYALTVEQLTGISRHDLAPEFYPRETMTDQAVGARFAGVDRGSGRQLMKQGAQA